MDMAEGRVQRGAAVLTDRRSLRAEVGAARIGRPRLAEGLSMRPAPPAAPSAHAGVRFPPPLLYVAGLAAGWALERGHPLRITAGSSAARQLAAAGFALGYLALFLGAYTAFRRARTTIVPNRPAAAVVTAGPYRWTRNPMYVSLICLYAAGALWLNTWWALALLPLVVLVVDRAVIAREERYLAAAFPTEYQSYRARVRRWL
jgi:protein-S-isoprenylcysteine O-methyltransferase Ste14